MSGMELYELNKSVLSTEERATAELLLAIGQQHLFACWSEPGHDQENKKSLLRQAHALNQQYPGGLKVYVENAKKLLKASMEGLNPYAGFTPSVPSGERLAPGTDAFNAAETAGVKELPHTAFVLVAGGLGERLGYSGIKVSLPVDLVSAKLFLHYYIDYILVCQTRARTQTGNSSLVLPFVIMTSDDTHEKTVKLLENNRFFGMDRTQISILKQEKVPALADNEARFAVSASNPYELLTKPHGHGDVHTLLHQSGLMPAWIDNGVKWVFLFQDTNALAFHALPAALGVSSTNGFHMNSITVPRKPGEAVGGICRLQNNDIDLTINVEYNQLDPLLRATLDPNGDVADASGFSPYPGNINALVLSAPDYLRVLERSNGSVPEFVNPKYEDADKKRFKKPTRLECMMQDYPRLLTASDKVGFTSLERWMCFSAVKNNVSDALKKAQSSGFAESASSAEADFYEANRRILRAAGEHIRIEEESEAALFCSIETKIGAKVVLSPRFALTQAEVAAKLASAHINISKRSTLLIDGPDVSIGRLDLDGTLIVRVSNGSRVLLKDVKVHNAGWQLAPLNDTDDEALAIRGYQLDKLDQKIIEFDDGQEHVITIQ